MLIPLGILAASGGGGGGAMELISTTILASTTTTVTFSSIASTYKHLQLRYVARSAYSSTGDNLRIQMNGDTGSNYAYHALEGNGSTVSSSNSSAWTTMAYYTLPTNNQTASSYGTGVIDILDYLNTNKNKTIRSLYGFNVSSQSLIGLQSGLWVNTAALTTLTLFTGTGSGFLSGSRISLYGIKG